MKVHNPVESFRPKPTQEVEKVRQDTQGVVAAQHSAVKGDYLVHINESPQQRNIFLGGQERDFCIREILPDSRNCGERQQHVPDGLDPY
ncbi:MAG: hypothetical protein WDM80_03075 [Limisphaerales bacterium]